MGSLLAAESQKYRNNPSGFVHKHFPRDAAVANMYINAVREGATALSIKITANSVPIVSSGRKGRKGVRVSTRTHRATDCSLAKGSNKTVCKWLESKLHG